MSEPTTDFRPPSQGIPTLRSPLSGENIAPDTVTTMQGGAELVLSFGDPDEDRSLIRDGVGLADITVRSKIDLRGRPDLAYAQASDDVVARIAPEWWLVFGPPGPVTDRLASMESQAGAAAMVTDVTHLYAGFALAGPATPDVIARLSNWDPATLAPGEATCAPVADVHAVVVRRAIDMFALDVYVGVETARYAWRSILPVVQRCGGGCVGWDALRHRGWH